MSRLVDILRSSKGAPPRRRPAPEKDDMSSSFTCAACKCTFQRVSTEEELSAERVALWGAPVQPDDLEVCDVCFRQLMAKMGRGLE